MKLVSAGLTILGWPIKVVWLAFENWFVKRTALVMGSIVWLLLVAVEYWAAAHTLNVIPPHFLGSLELSMMSLAAVAIVAVGVGVQWWLEKYPPPTEASQALGRVTLVVADFLTSSIHWLAFCLLNGLKILPFIPVTFVTWALAYAILLVIGGLVKAAKATQ
jgi:hypothetical protein